MERTIFKKDQKVRFETNDFFYFGVHSRKIMIKISKRKIQLEISAPRITNNGRNVE